MKLLLTAFWLINCSFFYYLNYRELSEAESVQVNLGLGNLNGELSPFAFGAKGDGRTDDTRAMQKAVDATVEQNKTLNLLNGNFKTTKPLCANLNAGQSLRITGNGAIIDFTSNCLVVNSVRDSIRSKGKIYINGITFQAPKFGDHYNTLNAINAILINGAEKIEIKNCTFRDIYGNGIALMGYCFGGEITRNKFTGIHGLLTVKIGDLLDCYGDGILIQDHCKNITVANNRIDLSKGQKGRCGISVDYFSSSIKIIENEITGYDRSIHIESSEDILVKNNKASATHCGIFIAFSKNVEVSLNNINGSNTAVRPFISHPALLFYYKSSHSKFSNNKITGWHKQPETTYAVKLWGSTLLFINNSVTNGPVFAYGDQDSLSIVNNTFEKSELDFSLSKNTSFTKNSFISSSLILSSTINCSVFDNYFAPSKDSLFSEKVTIYFAKNITFGKNKIESVRDFFIDDYEVKSYKISENLLYRKKYNDGTILMRGQKYHASTKNILFDEVLRTRSTVN